THKEEAGFTTTQLAQTALKRGHTVYYIGLADFIYQGERTISAHARTLAPEDYRDDREELIELLKEARKERINFNQVDVLWLRFDPSMDMINRPWAAATGIQFAQLIKENGRLVINDPDYLVQANNKLYLENFPKSVRPKTIVTRNHQDVLHFLETQRSEEHTSELQSRENLVCRLLLEK